MKKIKFLILTVLFTGIAFVNGQSSNEDLKNVESENAELNLINNQILQVSQKQIFEFVGNNINITQVGRSNLSNVITLSENSKLVLTQNGYRNIAIIDVAATTIDYSLVQEGSNNFMAEYTKASNIDLTRNFSQVGDRNNLVIHGSNSITKDLKLNIQGNAKTVIIRNFN